jgi:hypothetical protein
LCECLPVPVCLRSPLIMPEVAILRASFACVRCQGDPQAALPGVLQPRVGRPLHHLHVGSPRMHAYAPHYHTAALGKPAPPIASPTPPPRDLTRSSKHPLGGKAFLSLDDSEEPYLGGIKYNAMPPMKRFRCVACPPRQLQRANTHTPTHSPADRVAPAAAASSPGLWYDPMYVCVSAGIAVTWSSCRAVRRRWRPWRSSSPSTPTGR